MAYDENGATALEWYKNNFAPNLTIPELLYLAENIEVGCNNLIAQPSVDKFSKLSGFKNIKNYEILLQRIENKSLLLFGLPLQVFFHRNYSIREITNLKKT